MTANNSPNASHLYETEPENFYELQANSSKNPLRRWFHTTRSATIERLVLEKAGHIAALERTNKRLLDVVDFGCGNAIWNQNKLPVIGIDISEKTLAHTLSTGRISKSVCSDLESVSFPDNSADVIVCSEVLEHLSAYQKTIREAYRILRPGGFFVTSVPYDTYLSLWKPLFTLQCLYQGYVRNDAYYRKFCGHINHFSPNRIAYRLAKSGFRIVEQFDMKRITIFTVGQK